MNNIEITCPRCACLIGSFRFNLTDLLEKCKNCGFIIDRIHGIPNLRDGNSENFNMLGNEAKLQNYNSAKLNIPFIDNALESGLPILEIGGGADICDASNLIKTDAFLYSTEIDFIADAHALPFADEMFSYVYSLAVFEHLHSPWIAADEIYRVLKPGGEVYVLTAFTQHMHGYPDHYFNMTTSGLKRIFSNFDVQYSKPSIFSSFNQLSYIFMDFVNFVNDVSLSKKHAIVKNRLQDSVSIFCDSVEKLDEVLLNENNISDSLNKVAPSIELLALKKY